MGKINKSKIVEEFDLYLPGFAVNCVIFGFRNGKLKVLLNKSYNIEKWMLPSGFVYKNENIDDAAHRVLTARTGLENVFLNQLHLFGDKNRVDPKEVRAMAEMLAKSSKKSDWLLERIIAMSYYALVDHSKAVIEADETFEEVDWFDLNEIPELYADHRATIDKALETIRIQIGYIPIGYELLPEKFTMPELRAIYESIIGKELDRRNFQRKILSIGLINKLDEKRESGTPKAPILYSFIKEKYEEARKYGLQLMDWKKT